MGATHRIVSQRSLIRAAGNRRQIGIARGSPLRGLYVGVVDAELIRISRAHYQSAFGEEVRIAGVMTARFRRTTTTTNIIIRPGRRRRSRRRRPHGVPVRERLEARVRRGAHVAKLDILPGGQDISHRILRRRRLGDHCLFRSGGKVSFS